MRKPETAEEVRRRERRFDRRENQIRISAGRKKDRNENAVRQNELQRSAAMLLKKDKRQDKPDKRPGPGKFLRAFSYIGLTPYDKRLQIPPSYRCRSFNEQRQYIDFFREFIYPYKVPLLLLWAVFEKETVVTERGNARPSPDIEIIRSAKGWIRDIVSGDSFYKRNKDCFTRAEAHYFLNSEVAYNSPNSVIELVFYSRCMARKMGIRRSRVIAKIFAQKFGRHWNHPIAIGFLDLTARSRSYSVENGGLGDVCDFILSEIEKHRKARGRQPPFSFGKRTMASVIALANEWHADVLREQEARNALDRVRQIANRQTGKTARLVNSSSFVLLKTASFFQNSTFVFDNSTYLFQNSSFVFQNWTSLFDNWSSEFQNSTSFFQNWSSEFDNWSFEFNNSSYVFLNWGFEFDNWLGLNWGKMGLFCPNSGVFGSNSGFAAWMPLFPLL